MASKCFTNCRARSGATTSRARSTTPRGCRPRAMQPSSTTPIIRISAKPKRRRRSSFLPSPPGLLGGPVASLERGDPGAALRRLEAGEHPHLAGDQKSQRINGVPDPSDIGDDRDPLPLGNVLDPDPEVFPGGAREAATDLVIEPHFVVPLERAFHRRLEDLVAVAVGDAALGDDPHDIVREPIDNLDHRFAPLRTSRYGRELPAA